MNKMPSAHKATYNGIMKVVSVQLGKCFIVSDKKMFYTF